MYPEVWGAYHRQDDIRLESSSGGVFSALAEKVIADGGIVYGAVMEYTQTGLVCVHIACETEEGLRRLRGSKYIRSELGHVFFDIQRQLKTGRTVLFVGTPCQAAALEAFLGERPENLLAIDLICHGVPVPFVLKKCMEEQEAKHQTEIVDVRFRDKTEGWRNYSIVTHGKDGVIQSELQTKSDFMKLFLSNQFLRSSCYDCQFKADNYRSDITLGDFWGVETCVELPSEELHKGVSVVVIHSERGKRLFEVASDRMGIFPYTMEYFRRGNICYMRSIQKPSDNLLFSRMLTGCSTQRILQLLDRLQPLRRVGDRAVRLGKRMGICKSGSPEQPGVLPGKDRCYECRNCENVCPVGAISMQQDKTGVIHAVVDQEKCIHCNKCVRVCPRHYSGNKG